LEQISKGSDLVLQYNIPFQYPAMEAPSLLLLSSDISPWIHNSAPLTLQNAVTFLLVKFQIYILTSQAEFVGIQNGLIDIQLNLRDQMKQGPVLLCHLASAPLMTVLNFHYDKSYFLFFVVYVLFEYYFYIGKFHQRSIYLITIFKEP